MVSIKQRDVSQPSHETRLLQRYFKFSARPKARRQLPPLAHASYAPGNELASYVAGLAEPRLVPQVRNTCIRGMYCYVTQTQVLVITSYTRKRRREGAHYPASPFRLYVTDSTSLISSFVRASEGILRVSVRPQEIIPKTSPLVLSSNSQIIHLLNLQDATHCSHIILDYSHIILTNLLNIIL